MGYKELSRNKNRIILQKVPVVALEDIDKTYRRINRMDYKNAGVDIEAGYKSVELMKEHVKRTMRPEVLGGSWRIFRCIFPGKD